MSDRHPEDRRAHRQRLAQQLRVDAVRMSGWAGSGHPTSSMSAAELIAVLADGHLRYDFDDPADAHNDHLIFSKGHATPLLYALYRAAGAVTEDELETYRRLGSRLEGHPTPRLPWVDVATGSLGQGLPVGAGLAFTGRRLDRLPYRVWVLCGDSEMTEGSMWEAVEFAAAERLGNLVAVVDVNRLGQRGPTRYGWDLDAHARHFEGFGWEVIEVDGHDVGALDEAYGRATRDPGRPTAVLAKTVKGRGLAAVEDAPERHGKPPDDPDAAVAELGGVSDVALEVAAPEGGDEPPAFSTEPAELPTWAPGERVATREAFGQALAAVGSWRPDVVALDGEVSNSTGLDHFAEAHPERFVETYIAEQQMVAAAVGMQARHWTPVAATFAAFLSRAYDFVRMAAVSRARLGLVGSHAGVAIGEDGPSQMGLEDLAMMRAVHGSTVLYPCDANQAARLVETMVDLPGITYLRTTRGATPVVYEPGDDFPVGGCRVLRSSPDDQATVVAAGVTLHEALAAAGTLAAEGTPVRVVDLYSVKPLDEVTLEACVTATGGRLVTVEDHWIDGGLGDAVASALATRHVPVRMEKLAVRELPGSATPEEQLAAAGIDAAAIGAAVRRLTVADRAA